MNCSAYILCTLDLSIVKQLFTHVKIDDLSDEPLDIYVIIAQDVHVLWECVVWKRVNKKIRGSHGSSFRWVIFKNIVELYKLDVLRIISKHFKQIVWEKNENILSEFKKNNLLTLQYQSFEQSN